MILTPARRAKLIVFKILEYAEVGGVAPEDCGAVFDTISNSFDALCTAEGGETILDDMNHQVAEILRADDWEQAV